MRILTLLVSLAAILGAIAWARENTGSTLIRRAEPVGEAQSWTDYQWLSDLALLRPGYPNTARAMRWQPPATESEVTQLSARLSSKSEQTLDWHASPNGKRMLWLERSGSKWAIAAASLDGASISRWPLDERPLDFSQRGGNAAWLPDNRHFFMVRDEDPNLLVQLYDVESNSARPEELEVHFRVPSPRDVGSIYQGPVALGAAPPHRLFVTWGPVRMGNWQPPELILELDLSRKPISLREHRIAVLPGASSGSTVLSPDGKRVAMLVSHWPRSSTDQIQMELRTCGLDGEEQRSFGKVAVGRPTTAMRSPIVPRPRLLRWLPSGKGLSFEYRGHLYTIRDE